MKREDYKLAMLNGTAERIYADLVDKYIRERYSISDELSILRRRDENPAKFAEYYTYAEQCKARAKAELSALGGD